MRKHVKGNVSWVGFIDWELESFHGDDYSIMNGSSQNAYLIEEEKTVLIDTVWTPHRFDFVENLEREIDLKNGLEGSRTLMAMIGTTVLVGGIPEAVLAAVATPAVIVELRKAHLTIEK